MCSGGDSPSIAVCCVSARRLSWCLCAGVTEATKDCLQRRGSKNARELRNAVRKCERMGCVMKHKGSFSGIKCTFPQCLLLYLSSSVLLQFSINVTNFCSPGCQKHGLREVE